jgi:hypothetical protein
MDADEAFMYMSDLPDAQAMKLQSAILELTRSPETPVLHWCHGVLAMQNGGWVLRGAMSNSGARAGVIIVKDGNLAALTCVRETHSLLQSDDARPSNIPEF